MPCLTSRNGRNVYKLGAEDSRHVHLTFGVGWVQAGGTIWGDVW